MNIKSTYCVGFHNFRVDAPEGVMRDGYAPFEVDSDAKDFIFSLKVDYEPITMDSFVDEVVQEEEVQEIHSGHVGGRSVFKFGLDGVYTGALDCSADYRDAHLGLASEKFKIYTVDNALMVLYAIATAKISTLLMHASTIVNGGRSYLFLAPSGTGKSTHSQLWLKYIEGSRLLNDDNPVIVVKDNRAIVCGTPWSGKTPCYINESYPVGALVSLSQAKTNKIRRVSGIEAYGSLMTSTSGKRWERGLADGLHKTLDFVARNVPTYHLDCLPDEAAARICFGEVSR